MCESLVCCDMEHLAPARYVDVYEEKSSGILEMYNGIDGAELVF